MGDIRECGIVCPTNWVPLPIEPADDMKAWAKSTAAELCSRSRAAGYELDERALRRDLRNRAEDSRSREPFYAFAFYPDGFDASLGLLEVDLIHPDATVPRISLDWLAGTFSTHELGRPRISHSELPIGPAVRIRQDFEADDTPRRGPGVLLKTVTYGIRPRGTESALVFLMSWTASGIDDAIEEAADGISQTLTVNY